MRHVDTIFVHCTATRPMWWHSKSVGTQVAEVRRWHLARGWSDIGYHYLIGRNGQVEEGRPVGRTGAHVKGHNTGSIGIALFGGHGGSADDAFSDHFTPEQETALVTLIRDIQKKYPTAVTIRGHHEVANKACPCFQVAPWWSKHQEPPKPARKPSLLSRWFSGSGWFR